MTARTKFYRSDLIGKGCRRAGMISWDCLRPSSEEKSEADYGMSYTDAAFSFWWTLWKNNYEVFAADGWPSDDPFGLWVADGEHREDHSRFLLSVRGIQCS
ncbi:hypothetical protein ACVWXM_002416 [Bradyrhizobium sp. GM7.3]